MSPVAGRSPLMAMNVPDAAPADSRIWPRILAAYRAPRMGRSLFEIAVTALPFTAAWLVMALALQAGLYWLYALLVLPAAGLLVRLFMIQHDCGHGAFFRDRRLNDWVGRVIGVLTMTPYDHWQRSHAMHHACSGNLDRRGIGDVATLTVAEYRARSRWGRLRYRLFRHPAVLFGLGPAYLFLLQHRLPLGFMRKGWRPWISTMATNGAILVASGLLIWTLGAGTFLLVHLPVVLLAASAGVWLFYVQHQFERTHWARGEAWTIQDAALDGSSHYDLPPPLRWVTANIGVHHVHHLASRIPFYRLPEVLRDFPELRERGRLTLRDSLGCVRLVLWDEAQGRLVAFSDVEARAAAA